MKLRIVRAVTGASLLLGLGVLVSLAQPKGETVKVKGEVVDLWCFLEGGDRGADHKKCAIACAKAGNPIGLVTEKDEVYVMMGIKDHQPGRDVLIDKMAETVTVEGNAGEITPIDSGEKSTTINEHILNNVAIVGQNAAEIHAWINHAIAAEDRARINLHHVTA